MAQQHKCLYKGKLHTVTFISQLCGQVCDPQTWKCCSWVKSSLFKSGDACHVFLDLVAALPEVHLLPHHCAPHAEKTPKVVECTAVEGVFIGSTVFEVRDAVARHELPGGGVERNQVEVGAEQEQHDQWEQSHQRGHGQQRAIGAQPQLPGGHVTETRPETTSRKEAICGGCAAAAWICQHRRLLHWCTHQAMCSPHSSTSSWTAKYSTNQRWFLSPTQFSIQGQWWS